MFAATRTVTALAFATLAAGLVAAELPKDSPFQQAGNATTATPTEPLEFAGVSTVGKKTMINLYDRQLQHGFWVELGATSDGVTAVKYDSEHDQVTVRRNGVEKTLPLRAASGVTNGPAITVPVMTPPAPAVPPATTTPAAPPAAGAGGAQAPMDAAARTRARQEEEARMLVSDLLEIGMAQRKAYEEAQRRAAAGPTTPPGNATTPPAAPDATPAATSAAGQTSAPVATNTPSGG